MNYENCLYNWGFRQNFEYCLVRIQIGFDFFFFFYEDEKGIRYLNKGSMGQREKDGFLDLVCLFFVFFKFYDFYFIEKKK